MRIEDMAKKKILILGLGKEGSDSFKFFRTYFPQKILGLADQLKMEELPEGTRNELKKDRKIRLYLGKDYLKSLKSYEVIVKTPGIPWEKVLPFITKQQKITSQAEIFLDNCHVPIIGITGTKGKGTTASLVYEILNKGGLHVQLIGNIGKPVLSFLRTAKQPDFFIYEMSSHQLQNLKKSPSIAVFLNLYRAHLDYYKNFQEYRKAKETIALCQKKNDWFIFNKDQKSLKDLAKKTRAKKISFGLKSKSLDCYLKGEKMFFQGEEILGIKKVPLVGRFNLYNVMAAVSVASLCRVPQEKIKKAVEEFKPLLHRLEFLGEFKGVGFYNDSLATVPESTVSALRSLDEKAETLILGGYDAKQDFKELAKEILRVKVKNLVFFPPTGQKIWKEVLKLKGKKPPKAFFVENMKDAVFLAFTKTKKGKSCLLSPACPSFGIFRNYEERGNLFKKYVREYGKKKN